MKPFSFQNSRTTSAMVKLLMSYKDLHHSQEHFVYSAKLRGGDLKTNCPCPNTSCSRYGNCVECRAFHKQTHSATYCDRISGKARINSEGINLMDYAACAG